MQTLLGIEFNNPYDDIPVYYCKHCLSLKIKDIADEVFCDDCGNTDVIEGNIYDWEELYELKYGHKFIKNYGRKYCTNE